MGPKLQNVVDLYVHGFRDGHLSAALDKYVTDDLIEHSPGIDGGRKGLLAAYEPIINRHYRRAVLPLRGFEDGSKVFLHTFTSFGWRTVEHVTLDIFDTNADDHITEHWGVTTTLRPRSFSGHSQIDGPRWVTDEHLTIKNKDLIQAYAERCLIAGGDPDRYVSRTFVDHDPDLGPRRFLDVGLVIGSGNFVATAGHCADMNETSRASCDLYRVESGRIVEHWNAVEASPAYGG